MSIFLHSNTLNAIDWLIKSVSSGELAAIMVFGVPFICEVNFSLYTYYSYIIDLLLTRFTHLSSVYSQTLSSPYYFHLFFSCLYTISSCSNLLINLLFYKYKRGLLLFILHFIPSFYSIYLLFQGYPSVPLLFLTSLIPYYSFIPYNQSKL